MYTDATTHRFNAQFSKCVEHIFTLPFSIFANKNTAKTSLHHAVLKGSVPVSTSGTERQ
jgi:hypothetical protein